LAAIVKNTTVRKLDLLLTTGERVGDTYTVRSVREK
jgi:hypothetical protein